MEEEAYERRGSVCCMEWSTSFTAAFAAEARSPVLAPTLQLARLVLARQIVEHVAGTDADGQVDGVVASRGEQPHALQQVQGIEGPGHAAPPCPSHVQRRDHRPRDVTREEEEEGDVAHGEVHS